MLDQYRVMGLSSINIFLGPELQFCNPDSISTFWLAKKFHSLLLSIIYPLFSQETPQGDKGGIVRRADINVDDQCQVKCDQKTVKAFYASMPEELMNTQIAPF